MMTKRLTARAVWEWWTGVNERLGSFFLFFCIVASTFASVGVYIQSRTNAAQDATRAADQRSRTAENTSFLKCLDTYTTALSGSLPPVRSATQKRDAAVEARDKIAVDALAGEAGLRGALQKAVDETLTPADMALLLQKFAAFQKAAHQAEVASAELSQTRANNPYPPAPSKFCELP